MRAEEAKRIAKGVNENADRLAYLESVRKNQEDKERAIRIAPMEIERIMEIITVKANRGDLQYSEFPRPGHTSYFVNLIEKHFTNLGYTVEPKLVENELGFIISWD